MRAANSAEGVHEHTGEVDFKMFVRTLDVFCTGNTAERKIESKTCGVRPVLRFSREHGVLACLSRHASSRVGAPVLGC
jgi:hypothetical protein